MEINQGFTGCPECGEKYIFHPEDEGLHNIECGKCGLKFQIEIVIYCDAVISYESIKNR